MKYPGDQFMQSITVTSKCNRLKSQLKYGRKSVKRSQQTAKSVGPGGLQSVKAEKFVEAKKKRLICSFGDLVAHLESFNENNAAIKSGRKCAWHWEITFTKCMICDIPLHHLPVRGNNRGKICSVHYHHKGLFCLGYYDSKTLESKRDVIWCYPVSNAAQKSNRCHIEKLDN